MNSPAVVGRLDRGVRPLVEKLRERRQAVAWSRGQDTDYPTKWEPDALCQQAADEIERPGRTAMKATEVPGRLDSPLSEGLGITATKENEMTDHELIDRKLLEAAARAGKIPVHEWYVSGASILPIEGWPGKSWWNPLTDDGDAFRLAVTLKMGVDITGNAAWAMVENDLHAGYLAAIGSDSFAAARRAIVRAAAAMAAS